MRKSGLTAPPGAASLFITHAIVADTRAAADEPPLHELRDGAGHQRAAGADRRPCVSAVPAHPVLRGVVSVLPFPPGGVSARAYPPLFLGTAQGDPARDRPRLSLR